MKLLRHLALVLAGAAAGGALAALLAYLALLWHEPMAAQRLAHLIRPPLQLGAILGGAATVMHILIRR